MFQPVDWNQMCTFMYGQPLICAHCLVQGNSVEYWLTCDWSIDVTNGVLKTYTRTYGFAAEIDVEVERAVRIRRKAVIRLAKVFFVAMGHVFTGPTSDSLGQRL